MVHSSSYQDVRNNDAINVVYAPSLLESNFDMSHNRVEERLHLASYRSCSVPNCNESCRLVSQQTSHKVFTQGRRTKRALVRFLELRKEMAHRLVEVMLRERLGVVCCKSRYECDDHFSHQAVPV